MKIKILQSCSGPIGAYTEGEEVEIRNEDAISLLNAGIAEAVEEKPEKAEIKPRRKK